MTLSSVKRVLYLSLIVVVPAFANPVETSKPDLHDPQIWQTSPEPLSAQEKEEQCRVFQTSACPYAQDTQSDIQREAQRREQSRYDNIQKEGEWRRVKPR